MENQSKKFLCLEFRRDGVVVPELSKCPANPEMIMAAMQFITQGCCFTVSVQDNPIDFLSVEDIN